MRTAILTALIALLLAAPVASAQSADARLSWDGPDERLELVSHEPMNVTLTLHLSVSGFNCFSESSLPVTFAVEHALSVGYEMPHSVAFTLPAGNHLASTYEDATTLDLFLNSGEVEGEGTMYVIATIDARPDGCMSSGAFRTQERLAIDLRVTVPDNDEAPSPEPDEEDDTQQGDADGDAAETPPQDVQFPGTGSQGTPVGNHQPQESRDTPAGGAAIVAAAALIGALALTRRRS